MKSSGDLQAVGVFVVVWSRVVIIGDICGESMQWELLNTAEFRWEHIVFCIHFAVWICLNYTEWIDTRKSHFMLLKGALGQRFAIKKILWLVLETGAYVWQLLSSRWRWEQLFSSGEPVVLCVTNVWFYKWSYIQARCIKNDLRFTVALQGTFGNLAYFIICNSCIG